MENYHQSKPETIRSLFAGLAKRYDLTNNINSFGMHHLWNKTLVQKLLMPSYAGSYLDLCCGTGAIGLAFLQKTKEHKKAILLDFCPEMLAIAQKRAEKLRLDKRHEIHFVNGDAQAIELDDSSVSRVSIAYGIRNVCNPSKCLEEAHRVLTPTGQLGILELTRPRNAVLKMGHSLYLKTFLPLFGKLCTSNKAAYEYLRESIQRFIEPQQLANEMQKVGFVDIKVIPLTGGIAHIIMGSKRS